MSICIGEDVHSNLITCFAVPLDSYDEEELEFCREFNREFKSIRADRHALERMARWLEGIEHCILIENSTKTHEVYWTLIDLGCTVIVANPADLYRITRSVQKTDYHDCEELAHYMRRFMLGEKEFSQCLMVDSFWMNRRQLCRLYAQASSDLSDVRRRIRSYMLLRGRTVSRANEDITRGFNLEELERDADASLLLLIENARYLNGRLEGIKRSIRREFKDDPMFGLIKSIPGFGDVTSSYLTSLIVDVNRFDNASQFAAYFGIVPKQRESAGHAKRCGITHRGDDLARDMLVKGTFGHIVVDRDRQSNISLMYDRLRRRGMPHKKALVACSNKMARVMFAILRNGGPYEHDH